MPATAMAHLAALLFQLLLRRWGGSVLMNLRPAIVRAGAREFLEVRNKERTPGRNITTDAVCATESMSGAGDLEQNETIGVGELFDF